jgi:hypothetical protein
MQEPYAGAPDNVLSGEMQQILNDRFGTDFRPQDQLLFD